MDDVFVYYVSLPPGVNEMVTPCPEGYTAYIVRGKLFLQLHGNKFFHCTVSRFFTAW